jgi:REP element-mobilizing transposase RayT
MNNPLPNRQSIRLKNYDYSQPGYYFITICTQDRIHRFGKIIDEKMRLNDAGEIVADEWKKTPIMRKHIQLDEWIIMPNHFHAIITVGARCTRPMNNTRPLTENGRTENGRTENGRMVNGRMQSAPTDSQVVLGDIVRGFKSSVTKRVRQLPNMNDTRLWQRNYWEHIIRNENELNHIRNYIRHNPQKWEMDQLYGGFGNQLIKTPAEYGKTS